MPWKRGEDHYRWKGGRYLDKDGYVLIQKPDHPNHDYHGYVLEHRLIMEEYIGRFLRKDEDIHHINKNRQDNRIENLRLMTHGEHMILEHTVDMSERSCYYCGGKTHIQKKNGRPQWSYIKNELACNACYCQRRRHPDVF